MSVKPAVTVETEVQQLIDLSDVQQQGEVNYKNMPSVVVLLERLVLDKGGAESGVSKKVCHEESVSIEVERNESAFNEGLLRVRFLRVGLMRRTHLRRDPLRGAKLRRCRLLGVRSVRYQLRVRERKTL